MFNKKRIDDLERRIRDLERANKFYLEHNECISTPAALYIILNHLHLKILSRPATYTVEKTNE